LGDPAQPGITPDKSQLNTTGCVWVCTAEMGTWVTDLGSSHHSSHYFATCALLATCL